MLLDIEVSKFSATSVDCFEGNGQVYDPHVTNTFRIHLSTCHMHQVLIV